MSLEAMETLASVEERLKQRKADAAAKAKQSVADAREQGERLIAEALGKAASEIAALQAETDEKAKSAADALRGEGAAGRESLRTQAKQREEEAVSFVVERIVNG